MRHLSSQKEKSELLIENWAQRGLSEDFLWSGLHAPRPRNDVLGRFARIHTPQPIRASSLWAPWPAGAATGNTTSGRREAD